jgi:translation initiation factor IF-1
MNKTSKDGKEILVGIVTEALPDTKFRIQVEGMETLILGYLSGRMSMNRIRVQVGDSVEFELNPSGTSRITRRL